MLLVLQPNKACSSESSVRKAILLHAQDCSFFLLPSCHSFSSSLPPSHNFPWRHCLGLSIVIPAVLILSSHVRHSDTALLAYHLCRCLFKHDFLSPQLICSCCCYASPYALISLIGMSASMRGFILLLLRTGRRSFITKCVRAKCFLSRLIGTLACTPCQCQTLPQLGVKSTRVQQESSRKEEVRVNGWIKTQEFHMRGHGLVPM